MNHDLSRAFIRLAKHEDKPLTIKEAKLLVEVFASYLKYIKSRRGRDLDEAVLENAYVHSNKILKKLLEQQEMMLNEKYSD